MNKDLTEVHKTSTIIYKLRSLFIRRGFFISAGISGVIIALFLLLSPFCFHWFLFPVWMCGTIVGADVVDWIQGRMDVLDPRGVVSVIGFHFFFLAPLLHVYWERWIMYVEHPSDWRVWLGAMAVLNAFGLFLYLSSRLYFIERKRYGNATTWQIIPNRLYLMSVMLFFVACSVQIYIYSMHDGILGFMNSFTRRQLEFEGLGWMLMIAESAPKFAIIAWAVYANCRKYKPSLSVIIVVLVFYFILTLFFGGLRGSRSNIIWALFFAVGVIHLYVRPIPRKIAFGGIVFLIFFMYLYGFYKAQGVEVFYQIQQGQTLNEFEEDSGRNISSLLLGDLARSDVQAFILYRQISDANVKYGYGRSYMGALALLIPKSMWPERPPTKVKEGTQIQYGANSYVPSSWVSSRVYGLAGEWMLNFGPALVPLSFIFLGLLVGLVGNAFLTWPPSDARWLLYPLLVNLCFVVLVGDSDNVIFFLVKNCLIPIVVIKLSVKKLLL